MNLAGTGGPAECNVIARSLLRKLRLLQVPKFFGCPSLPRNGIRSKGLETVVRERTNFGFLSNIYERLKISTQFDGASVIQTGKTSLEMSNTLPLGKGRCV
jgi:hypothetical protein